MRIVIQRVTSANVTVDGSVKGAVGPGFAVLVGVATGDTTEDALWLASKTAGLRVFDDDNGVMNRSITDIGGRVLAISQFTLNASTRKGNRPSYIHAAPGEEAEPLYRLYCKEVERLTSTKVERGVFGAHMVVSIVNDGPVTIIIDSKLRE